MNQPDELQACIRRAAKACQVTGEPFMDLYQLRDEKYTGWDMYIYTMPYALLGHVFYKRIGKVRADGIFEKLS